MIWLLWLMFTAAILAAWLTLGFIAVTVIRLSQQAARRRLYQALTERAIEEHPECVADAIIQAVREQPAETCGADFYRCGCTITAARTAWVPCPAHEALAEVEARTEHQ
jgi:hypothetical protein